MNYLKRPKDFMIIILSLVLITSLLAFPFLKVLINSTLCIGLCISFDVLLIFLRKIKLFRLNAALVTGLILSLLIGPNPEILKIAVAAFASMFSKNFIRLKGFHIFNPAAFGLLITTLLFKSSPSWWGASWGIIPFLTILIFVGYLLIFKLRKMFLLFSFYITVFLISLLTSSSLNLLWDYTLLFFVFIMVCEPMTSPNKKINQIIYGSVVAVLSIFTPSIIVNYTRDPLITALLLGNIFNFGVERAKR